MKDISSASLQADDMENVEELAQTIRSLGYDVYTNVEYINGMKKTLGMVQAVLVGMAAGYFPAVRAMKLSPLAAIRNE